MSGVRNPREAIDDAHQRILLFRRNRPLLLKSDLDSPTQLVSFALNELNEFIESWLLAQATPTLENLLHALDELYDTFFFVSSYGWVALPTLDITQNIGRMNGRGGRSDFIEQLRVLIEEAGANPKEIPWVVAFVQSVIRHSFYFEDGEALPHFGKTAQKAEDNRPKEGYEDYDPFTGELLSDIEKVERRTFTEAAYRLMRKYLDNPLKREEVRLFQRHLLFWRMGADQLALLRAELERHTAYKLTSNPHEIIIF